MNNNGCAAILWMLIGMLLAVAVISAVYVITNYNFISTIAEWFSRATG